MSGSSNLQQTHAEGTASQQQHVVAEAGSGRLVLTQEQQRHADEGGVRPFDVLTGRREFASICTRDSTRSSDTLTRAGNFTNSNRNSEITSAAVSDIGKHIGSVTDSSAGSRSRNTDSIARGRIANADGGLQLGWSIAWGLPAVTTLCGVHQQHQTAEPPAPQQVFSGQKQKGSGAGENDDGDNSICTLSNVHTRERGPELEAFPEFTHGGGSSDAHAHGRARYASMSDSPVIPLCLAANASLVSHASAHVSGGFEHGALPSINVSTHKRNRPDSSASSSCSENEDFTGTTTVEISPGLSALPHALPASPALPSTSTEEAAADGSSHLSHEKPSEDRDREEAAGGAHLHAALLQRLCVATPRRRKLSSSSCSAVSDEQQTVASISSPAMLYTPLHGVATRSSQLAQQQQPQLQQDELYAQSAQVPLPEEPLHQLQDLGGEGNGVPHGQLPRQLSQPGELLSMSAIRDQQLHQEEQRMRQHLGQHTLRMPTAAAAATEEEISRNQNEVGGMLLSQGGSRAAAGSIQPNNPIDVRLLLGKYEAQRITLEAAEPKRGAPSQFDPSIRHSAGVDNHHSVPIPYPSYQTPIRGAERAATVQSGLSREFAGPPGGTISVRAGPGATTTHPPVVVSSSHPATAGFFRDTALSVPEQPASLSTNQLSHLSLTRVPESLPPHRQQQQQGSASSAFAAVSQMLQQHLGRRRTSSIVVQKAETGSSTGGGEDVAGSSELPKTSLCETASQRSLSAGSKRPAARQSALYTPGQGDETVLPRTGASARHHVAAADAADSSVALVECSDAPSPPSSTAAPTTARPPTAVEEVEPHDASGSFPTRTPTVQDFIEDNTQENAQAQHVSAGVTLARVVDGREPVMPPTHTTGFTEGCGPPTPKHPTDFFKRLLQQVAILQERNVTATDSPSMLSPAFISSHQSSPPRMRITSLPDALPQPSVQDEAVSKEAVSPVAPQDGPHAFQEARRLPGAAAVAALSSGSLTVVKNTAAVAARAARDTQMSEATPSMLSSGGDSFPFAADTRRVRGTTAGGHAAVGNVAAGDMPTGDRSANSGTVAGKESRRNSCESPVSRMLDDTQHGRVQQLLLALREQRRRIGIMLEQTVERMMQTTNPLENNTLRARLQRFQQQQQLLLQLQQRLESRASFYAGHDRGVDGRLQQQQQEDHQGEQQRKPDRQGRVELQQLQRKFQEEEGFNQGSRREDTQVESVKKSLPHSSEAGNAAEDSQAIQQHAIAAETDGQAEQMIPTATTDEAKAEALRAPHRRTQHHPGFASASTTVAGDRREDVNTTKGESTCIGIQQRGATDEGPEADFPSQERHMLHLETETEEHVAALQKQQHEADVAALRRVRQTFLRQQQQLQMRIPSPEESVSEMYWASLLQPTEMLLDRAVALNTSLIQPGVYVYLNKCFWESNQRDWASHPDYPYSCSSSSCSSSVPCVVSRPAVDLLPVYYSSHCTPVQALAGLPPAAAAAAAVAPSDADSIMNFCYRVSLLRRRRRRQRRLDSGQTKLLAHRDRTSSQRNRSNNPGSNNANSDDCGSSSVRGVDFSSRRRANRDQCETRIAAERETCETPLVVSAEQAPGDGHLQAGISGAGSAPKYSSGINNEFTQEEAVQNLLPFLSNISPLRDTGTGTVATSEVSPAGAVVAVDDEAATHHTATRGTVPCPCRDSTCTVAGDANVVPRASGCVPVLPPLELRGPRPAWVFQATRAAAAAASAALAAARISDGVDEEAHDGKHLCYNQEDEQQQGLYASSVPVSLYGFSLSRRFAAAARDAAFNQIAAAAAVSAATSRRREDASMLGRATAPVVSERLAGVQGRGDTDVSMRDAGGIRCEDVFTGGNRKPARRAGVERRHDVPAVDSGGTINDRRRSSVSSACSRDGRSCASDEEGAHRGTRRSHSERGRDFDSAWYKICRDVLLRRDPPLRKAWVCNSGRRRGSCSDHRTSQWNKSVHVAGGGGVAHGASSPSPYGSSWRPHAPRSTCGGGGSSAGAANEERFFAFREQQQSSTVSLDIHTQAEGIFVLRERGTGLPVAVRATVFCPDEESSSEEAAGPDVTTVAESLPAAGTSPSVTSSSSKISPQSSPTRLLQQHTPARRGGQGAAASAPVGNSSSVPQGGQLLSKLFVVAAHATAAEEPMPVKLGRVKQMAKAWFRHKKLLALLLYWQRSQQHERRTLETQQHHAQQTPHPAREGKRDLKKRATSEVPAAAPGPVDSHVYQSQGSGDEATPRLRAETRGLVEKEALACLLKDERQEACYISHLHFLGHALVSRFSSLVAAASLAWCSHPQAAAGNRGRSGDQECSDGRSVESITHAKRERRSTGVVSGTGVDVRRRDNNSSGRSSEQDNSRDAGVRVGAGIMGDASESSHSGESASLSGFGSSFVTQEEGEQKRSGTHDDKTRTDDRTSCWSLRVGVRWRESYFAFEYYVAAVYVPIQRQAPPQQRRRRQAQSCKVKREGEEQPQRQQQEERSATQCPRRQGHDDVREEQQAADYQEELRPQGPVDDHDNADDSTADKSSSSGCPDMAGNDGASAVLLLDEMLQPCLCDVIALQHAFQAVVVRLLPFLCINSFMLRMLLEQSPELRDLSSSILRQWGKAPARAPDHRCQCGTEQHYKRPVKPSEPQQERVRAANRTQDFMHVRDTTVIDEVAAAVETEERLQRSAAVAVATAFHKSASSPTSDLKTGRQALQVAGRDAASLSLFLFDCLLQSGYPYSDSTALPHFAASGDSATPAFDSAVAAPPSASAGGILLQPEAAAMSLLLAAGTGSASMLDSGRSCSSTTTETRTEYLVERSWFPFRLQRLKEEPNFASHVRRLLTGTLARGGGATAAASAASMRSCASSSSPSTAAGTSGASTLESKTEAYVPQKEDTASKEPRKKDPAAKLEKQIRWIGVRCSYIGVTDAPATSLKAALLLALLFPSQRQLLLEHLQLRNKHSYNAAFHAESTTGIAAERAAPPRISESHLPQRQGLDVFYSPQHFVKEEEEADYEEKQLFPQISRPRDAKQQGRYEHVDEKDGSQNVTHKDKQETQQPKQYDDDALARRTYMIQGESSVSTNEEYLDRVIVAAQMMLEGALEELWPAKDGEENTWHAIFTKSSSKREGHEEMRMLSTEIPLSLEKEAVPSRAQEAAASPHSAEHHNDRNVATLPSDDLKTGRQTSVDKRHAKVGIREEQHQQKQGGPNQEPHKCDQPQEKLSLQQNPPLKRTAERQGGLLKPQRATAIKKGANGSSFEAYAAARRRQKEEVSVCEDEPDAVTEVRRPAAASAESASMLIAHKAGIRDANATSDVHKQDASRVSEGAAGRVQDKHAPQGDRKEVKGDGVHASSIGAEQQQRELGRGRSSAPDKKQHSEGIPRGESDEDEDSREDMLKQLLLLPVELSDRAKPGEENVDVDSGSTTGVGINSAANVVEDQMHRRSAARRCTEVVTVYVPSEGRHGATAPHVEGKRSKLSAPETALKGDSLISFKGKYFFSAFPSPRWDAYGTSDEGALSAGSNTRKITFDPIWAAARQPSPGGSVSAPFPWSSALAFKLGAQMLELSCISKGRSPASREESRLPLARGGADFCLLLRWCGDCVAASAHTKNCRSRLSHTSRSTLNSYTHTEGTREGPRTAGGNNYFTREAFNNSKATDLQGNTDDGTDGIDNTCNCASEGVPAEDPRGEAGSEAALEKLLLACSHKGKPQQPPLWAGGIDVSSLREGLDYRIDWRLDWDIGDGHVEPLAADKADSSSTIVDSNSNSEEEEMSAEEREARGETEGNASTETERGTETEHGGGGISTVRGAATAGEGYGEAASGMDDTQGRQQDRKKTLRERLLSSASAGRAAVGGGQSQALTEEKPSNLSVYFEERLVDQQLRDFLQGLFTIVRHARVATHASKGAPQASRTTGTSGRSASSGGGYQEDLFPGGAGEGAAGLTSGGETVSKQPMWSADRAAPTWLYTLAAAEAAQRQLGAAATGRLPRTSSSLRVWPYLLRPAAKTTQPAEGSASPLPGVSGRPLQRQQQEEVKKQQEDSTALPASALAAAAALLREPQEGSGAMLWTSLYLAAATDAATAAAAATRQAAAPAGCQTRHRAELSLPSSTCSTPRYPPQPIGVAHGAGGPLPSRRGGGSRSVPASPSPTTASDAAADAAPTAAPSGSVREGPASARIGGSHSLAAAAAAAAEAASSVRGTTSGAAGGGAAQLSQTAAGLLSSSIGSSTVGLTGVKPQDSAAGGPNPLASALLAALQQQPPPTPGLPHHFVPQHQRLSQQHPGPLHMTGLLQQPQPHVHRRVSWDTEMRQSPSESSSSSSRGTGTARGTESSNERPVDLFVEGSKSVASAAAEALPQLQQGDVRRSLFRGRRRLQGDTELSASEDARGDVEEGSRSRVSAAEDTQQPFGDVPQRPQESSPEATSTQSPSSRIGDVQMETMLQQLAAALLPSSPKKGTSLSKEVVPTAGIGEADADPRGSIESAEVAAPPVHGTLGSLTCRLPVREEGYAEEERHGSSSVVARHNEHATRRLHGGSARATSGDVDEAADAFRTQARQQKLQEVLRALAIAVEESEARDTRQDPEGRVSAELQQLMAVKQCLEVAMEQGRVEGLADASRAGLPKEAATAAQAGQGSCAAASPGSRTPEASVARGSTENEYKMYSLLYGQTGAHLSSAAKHQVLQEAAQEGLGAGRCAGSGFLRSTPSTAAGDNSEAAEPPRGLQATGEASALSLFPPAVTASAERGLGEEECDPSRAETTLQNTEEGTEAAVGAPVGAGALTDVDASLSPAKKKRSRHAVAGALTEASASSAAVSAVRERGNSSSRSPSRSLAFELIPCSSAARLSPTSDRGRRSRRGSSSSSRRSGEGQTATPRGSSGAGLEMAAAAATATAELAAREETGAVTPRRGRYRSRWSGSVSPSPQPRPSGNLGGSQDEGGSAMSSQLKQLSTPGGAGGGEDEMVPLGALPTGVYFDVARRLWRCQWREEGRLKSKGFSLGHYATLEEAREACILYKCAVSNIPLDPAWLVPEYLPASMASKRLLKHRQPSSVPPTSQENSPAATGTDEPHSPFAAGSSMTNTFTAGPCDKSLGGGYSQYGTPTTPRSASAGGSTDDCGATSHFLSPPAYTAGATGTGVAGFPGGEDSISSSTLLPSIPQTATQDSRRGGIASGSPRRRSFESEATASFLSTESSKQLQRGQQQLYDGDSLLPMTPSSDTETGTGQSSTSNRKRRRFASAAGLATASVGTGVEAVGTDLSQVVTGTPSAALTALHENRGGTVQSVYLGDSRVSALSAVHHSSGATEHQAQDRQRAAWMGRGMLLDPEQFGGEVADGGSDDSNWPSAAEVKEATAAVRAALSHEAPDCWSVGAAALHAATDALPALAADESGLNLGGRRSTSQSPRRQLSLLTAAAAAAAAAYPPSEAQEGDRHAFPNAAEGERQHTVLAIDTPETVTQLHQQAICLQQRASLSAATCEQEGPSESDEQQRVRLVELLRLVAGAASDERNSDSCSSAEVPPPVPGPH